MLVKVPKSRLQSACGYYTALALVSGAVEVSLYFVFGVPMSVVPVMIAGVPVFSLLVLWHSREELDSSQLGLLASLWGLFLGWSVLSVTWSPAFEAQNDKLTSLLLFSCSFLIVGFATALQRTSIEAFRRGVIVLGTFVAICAIATLSSQSTRHSLSFSSSGQAFKLLYDSYQAITFCLGAAAALSLTYILEEGRTPYFRVLMGIVWAVLLAGAASAGGRSATLGTGVAQLAVVAIALFSRKSGSSREGLRWIFVLVPSGLAGLFIVAVSARLTLLIRVASILLNPGSDSTGRNTFWERALQFSDLHPAVGSGLGSYSMLFGGVEDVGTYAHNVPLDILVDTGLVGLFLFTLAVVFIARAVLRRWSSYTFSEWSTVVVVTIMPAVQAAVSDDFTSRILAFAVGFAMALGSKAATNVRRSTTGVREQNYVLE